MRRRPAVAVLLAAALVAAAGAATAGGPAPSSLPKVGSGERPGPDALYLPPPKAPQLQNTGPWKADPILVSGAESYRDGEWLYQDFLFDDAGATGVKDNADPYGASAHLYSPRGGTFTYPKDPVYANNAADLVELRVKPLAQATAFRVTLNTLQDPERSAFTIALGESPAARDWPHDAGVSSSAQLFLTWHGSEAELRDAATGTVLSALTPTVDLERRQVEVRVPHGVWDPGSQVVRTTVGVGLWDPAAGTYLTPQPGQSSATVPGGGTPLGVAIVNVGPRFDEPLPDVVGATMADTAVGAAATAPWWRERQQSLQLAQGDVTPFSAQVDFRKLADRERDDSGVPQTGPINRLFASRYVFGQGLDPSKVCFSISAGYSAGAECIGRQVGQLQPYSVYVPEREAPERGFGLTLLLHSLSANYNQYTGTENQRQLGERGAGSIVVTPAGRGPDGFYAGVAEADTFEVWADVARHYRLDADWTAVTGYSMGGFGTYRLLARYPDLFARGWSVVATPGSADDQLVSLRNTPVLNWVAAGDELVNIRETEEMQQDLTAQGLRYEHVLFPTADHLTLAGNDEYQPGADWLGSHRVDRAPSRVTYVLDPREDNGAAHVVADGAYWLSDLVVRDAEASPTATVDVRSLAFGQGEHEVLPVENGAGVLTGGNLPALPYTVRSQSWSTPEPVAAEDRLVVEATNLATLTIDVERARVGCDVVLDVTTDGPVTVVLEGCDRVLRFDG
ncbi:MAG: hypothetical protein ACLGIG_08870 [Actinomycetes bacterium]